jgi:hypothetical protein
MSRCARLPHHTSSVFLMRAVAVLLTVLLPAYSIVPLSHGCAKAAWSSTVPVSLQSSSEHEARRPTYSECGLLSKECSVGDLEHLPTRGA